MVSESTKFITLEQMDVLFYWIALQALAITDTENVDEDGKNKRIEEASSKFWKLLNTSCQAALKKEYHSLDQDYKALLARKESAKVMKTTGYPDERYDAEISEHDETKRKRLDSFGVKVQWIVMCAAKRYGVTFEELQKNIPEKANEDLGIYSPESEIKWKEVLKAIEADWVNSGNQEEPKYHALWKMCSLG